MKRPNILFAFADDWGRYASAYAAHHGERSLSALIDTPHFDRVAAEGVLFTNALVPAPSCTPCRSSILSGRYFWQTGLGAILLGAVWDRAIPSYPFLLRDAGYHIGFSNKVWSPGTPRDDPYGGTGTRYQDSGSDFNQFSFRATEWAGEAGGVERAKVRLYEEVRGNFRSFPGRPGVRSAVLLLVGADQHAPRVAEGVGQGAVGARPRRADRPAAGLPARRARRARGRLRLPGRVHGGGPWTRGAARHAGGDGRARRHAGRGLRRPRDPGRAAGEVQPVRHRLRGGAGRAAAGDDPGRPGGGRHGERHGRRADLPGGGGRGAAGRHARSQPDGHPRLGPLRAGQPGAHVRGHRPRAARGDRARPEPALSASRDPHARLPLHQELRPGPLADGRPPRNGRSVRAGAAARCAGARHPHRPTPTWTPVPPRRG